jgi:hypothetical protein
MADDPKKSTHLVSFNGKKIEATVLDAGVPVVVGIDYGAADGDRAAFTAFTSGYNATFEVEVTLEEGSWEKLDAYFRSSDDAADAARYAADARRGTYSNRLNDFAALNEETIKRMYRDMADAVYADQWARSSAGWSASRPDRDARAKNRERAAFQRDEARGVRRVPTSHCSGGAGYNGKPVIDVVPTKPICQTCNGEGVNLRETSFAETEKLGVDGTWMMCKSCLGVMPPRRRT